MSKAYVDRTRLTDHHAILPTGQKPSPTLSSTLRQMYDLVVARFVAMFLPDQVVEETTVTLDIGGATFVAKGSVELDRGWRVVEPRRGEREEPEQQVLPPLEQGQPVHIETLEVVEKETQPPRPYTDAALLAAMKNAGRDIEDDALAEAMKASGLGTPATRAEIIERLIRSGYVQRERKALTSTDKGRALIGRVAKPLRSPELTAAWEQQLKDIEGDNRSAEAFYRSIADFVRELVPHVAAGAALSPEQVATAREQQPFRKQDDRGRGSMSKPHLGTCPLCQQGTVREGAKAYGCTRYQEGCRLTIWKVVANKKLTEKQVKALVTRGHTDWLRGFTSKAGKTFEARLKVGEEARWRSTSRAVRRNGERHGVRRRPEWRKRY